jgi:hypothetical protein
LLHERQPPSRQRASSRARRPPATMADPEEDPDLENEGEEEEEEEEDDFDPTPMYEEVLDTPNPKLLRTSQVDLMKQPESYRSNTPKEEIMLAYLRKFEMHFANLHPKRRMPLLMPRNECGMRKFICTNLRPTQLPYQDVYDYDTCAKFVASFIRYEPLELAGQLPQHMPSPSATLAWQAGDCFDMAQVLASLLLGVGYDAYVASGYAPATITRCDQTSTSLPQPPVPPPPPPEEVYVSEKYKIAPRKVLESNFLANKAAREASAKDKAKATDVPVVDEEALAAAEAEELDDLKGKRVHAWVVVLPGKRMLEQLIFIEPSTGQCYTAEQCPYYGIESAWNSTNYWVNMQGTDTAAGRLDFDMNDTRKWEWLLFDSTASSAGFEGGDEDGEGGMAGGMGGPEEEEVNDSLTLADMPPSWVARLHVPKDLFENECPNKYKAIQYRKGQIEHFSPYSREDGLVMQVKLYDDPECTELFETRQTFANRKDKLYRRVTQGLTTHEFFEPGRPAGLKEHIHVEDERRELHFYSTARLDGLVTRVEEVGKKTWMIFDGSRDPLVYRSVSFLDADSLSADASPDKHIRKMAEKFRRSPDVDAEVDVAKRTFELAAGLIKVRYHFGDDRVTHSSKTFAKDGSGHTIVQVNSFSRQPTDAQMLDEFTKLQAAERECINEIRDYDRQTKELLKKRDYEEQAIEEAIEEAERLSPGSKQPLPQHLTVSVYDTARSKLNMEDDDDDGEDEVPHDYLTPFLQEPIGVDDDPLSREDALQAREACLRSLKDRLVERANIVQSRLDDENQALSKRQAAFQRNRDHMDPSDEAEYERYCQDAMFRIQILEQRLDRHTELSLQKYAEMDARLRDDPRLRKLSSTSR